MHMETCWQICPESLFCVPALSPPKKSVYFRMSPQSPSVCQTCIFTTRSDPFLVKGSKWPIVSAGARNAGSARTHRRQEHPVILLTKGKNWGAWVFHYLFLDSWSKLASCLCSRKTVAERLMGITMLFPSFSTEAKTEIPSIHTTVLANTHLQNMPSSVNVPQIHKASHTLPPLTC